MFSTANFMKPYLVQRIRVQRASLPEDLSTVPSLKEFYAYALDPRATATPEAREKYKVSLDGMNALIPLDYMGSAEFEFGSVGKALSKIAVNADKFQPFQLTVTGQPYDMFPSDRLDVTSTTTLFGWVQEGQRSDLVEFILDEIRDGSKFQLKERSSLQEGCFGQVRTETTKERVKANQKAVFKKKSILEPSSITGWLDLENGWFLSTNKVQASGLAHLLGVKVQF